MNNLLKTLKLTFIEADEQFGGVALRQQGAGRALERRGGGAVLPQGVRTQQRHLAETRPAQPAVRTHLAHPVCLPLVLPLQLHRPKAPSAELAAIRHVRFPLVRDLHVLAEARLKVKLLVAIRATCRRVAAVVLHVRDKHALRVELAATEIALEELIAVHFLVLGVVAGVPEGAMAELALVEGELGVFPQVRLELVHLAEAAESADAALVARHGAAVVLGGAGDLLNDVRDYVALQVAHSFKLFLAFMAFLKF